MVVMLDKGNRWTVKDRRLVQSQKGSRDGWMDVIFSESFLLELNGLD